MSESWNPRIRHIVDGEPVSAGVASRPDRVLESRTEYLKARIDSAELGQAVYAHEASLHPDVLVGQPVFWNKNTQRFEQAIAKVEEDPGSGVLVPSASSDVLGIVAYKENPTKGSVLLFGYAAVDITNAVVGTPEAGRYYLSSLSPGKLTKQKPPVSVSVLYYDGHGHVFVQPTAKDFLEDHIHYRFALKAEPAGTTSPPPPNGRHEITSPDPTKQGWLPANHPIFQGKAPVGAAWGYNLKAHPDLERVWPPIPVEAASIVWDKGQNRVGGTEAPLGPNGLVVIDTNGIWWMSDCYGDVPWPVDYNSGSPPPPPGGPLECPREERMSIVLSFAKATFATDKTVVTSLKPDEGSPIVFVDCDGNPASTGDLFARLNTEGQVIDNDFDGNLAIKDVDGLRFKKGYIVQGIRSSDNRIVLSGTRTKTIGGSAYRQGLIELSLNLDSNASDLSMHIVRLDDVKERHYQDVLYLGFPPNIDSKVRCKIKIPTSTIPPSPRLKFRMLLLGRANGTLPALQMSYRRVPRPGSGAAPLPTNDTPLSLPPGGAITTDHYVEIESPSIIISPGDVVFFTIRRTPDSYSGEIGLLDLTGIVHPGS